MAVELNWGCVTRVTRELVQHAVLAKAPVFVLADGSLGGHAIADADGVYVSPGSLASASVVEVFEDLSSRQTLTANDVTDALLRAHRRIVNHELLRLRGAPSGAPSGTGLVGLAGTGMVGLVLLSGCGNPEWLAVNVGVNRLYRYRGGELTKICVEHSIWEHLVGCKGPDSGYLGDHNFWLKGVTTRCLGCEESPQADIQHFPVEKGDRLLLCSFSLYDAVAPDAIVAALAEGSPPQDVAERLADLALAKVVQADVSAVVIDVLSPDLS